jgi:hypothetical protein
MVSLKAVCALKIYQNTKCHVPMLSGGSFAFTSEVGMNISYSGMIAATVLNFMASRSLSVA